MPRVKQNNFLKEVILRNNLPNNVIVNGFDRCGSSAICRILCQHPDIELIFQPFNSGPIRRIMYQVMSNGIATPQDHAFFAALANNQLDCGYIVSEWHKKYSTVQAFQKGRLHLLKTTINHFTILWVKRHYPRVQMWGIWRDPLAILASIERNHFAGRWYSDALDEIAPAVAKQPMLSSAFGRFMRGINSECQATAFLIAVRSYYFFTHLDSDKCVNYQRFIEQPNVELGRICEYFGLPPFDFEQFSDLNWNVSGKPFEKGVEHSGNALSRDDLKFSRNVFEPLMDLYCSKFCRS